MEVPVELKKKYLDRRVQDLQNLKSSLVGDDYTLAMKLGHQVKGNAVTFEFPQMAHFGDAMEKAAKMKDKEQVQMLICKLESMIQDARQSFLS